MIPDIGWKELFIVAAVTLVVLGPHEIPRAIRAVTQSMRKIRALAGEFLSAVEDSVKQADLIDADAPSIQSGVAKRVNVLERQLNTAGVDALTQEALGMQSQVQSSINPIDRRLTNAVDSERDTVPTKTREPIPEITPETSPEPHQPKTS